jgi:hypothetical protein
MGEALSCRRVETCMSRGRNGLASSLTKDLDYQRRKLTAYTLSNKRIGEPLTSFRARQMAYNSLYWGSDGVAL